jgi:hypothetical protein
MTKIALHTAFIWFACLLPSDSGLAAEGPEDLALRIDAIKSEFNNQKKDLPKRKRFTQEYTQLQVSTGKQLLELVRKAPKEPASADALIFLLSLSLYKDGLAPAVRLLTENHAATQGVGRSFVNLGLRDPDACLKFARAVVERNPNRDDRARAYLAIGLHYKKNLLSGNFSETDRSRPFQEAKQAFETVLRQYADAKCGPLPIEPIAKSELAGLLNIDHLAAGKEAPDIIGIDMDGQSLRFSDYRGKVVLLDFWAHW